MPKNFSRYAANHRVGIEQSVEGRLDGDRILVKTTEGLFLCIKEMRAAGAQGLDKSVVVTAPRLKNNISTACRSEQPYKIELLRRKRLLTDDQNSARNKCARLLRDTANKGAYLVAPLGRDNVEHGLPGWVGNS